MKKLIKIYNENERRVFEGIGMYDYSEPNDIRELLNNACDKYKTRTAFKYKQDGKGFRFGYFATYTAKKQVKSDNKPTI